MSDPKPRNYAGLHNVVAYSTGLFSGSVPEGAEGFESLRRLGVRTILSVDGAQPELALAQAAGLRYVHLPIGYDGIKRERSLEIARAVRELPGPIYLHCHHGKHRSATAAGAAMVTLGMMSPSAARDRMVVSGTSPQYAGLFRCVETARVASDAELSSASAEFPQFWATTGIVRTMVEIDHAFDHLKQIEKSGWVAPADHPDLVPSAEAGLLADLLRNLKDDESCRAQPNEFLKMLALTARDAESLETLLVSNSRDISAMSGWLEKLNRHCRECHEAYRD